MSSLKLVIVLEYVFQTDENKNYTEGYTEVLFS